MGTMLSKEQKQILEEEYTILQEMLVEYHETSLSGVPLEEQRKMRGD